jgi:hypothetical protein
MGNARMQANSFVDNVHVPFTTLASDMGLGLGRSVRTYPLLMSTASSTKLPCFKHQPMMNSKQQRLRFGKQGLIHEMARQ